MADKYTTIEVTQDDIDKAMRKASARCVLSTAVARTIPGATKVAVDLQTLRFTVDGERHIYLTPPAAVGYVIAFDAGDEIHPFAFRLSERYKVHARNNKKTTSGRERAKAGNNLRRAERQLELAETRQAEAPPDDPIAAGLAERVVKEAKAKVVRRKRERKAVEAEHAGQPHWEPDMTPDEETGNRKVPAPPQQFKRGTRNYGHRDLRINRDEGPDAEAARRSVRQVYDESIEV